MNVSQGVNMHTASERKPLEPVSDRCLFARDIPALVVL